MKLIDKFLKKLGVNRNTFATYILTLISIYLVVDRITEMILMIFTGVAVSYWGPIAYTFALACPFFAFLFSGSSEFASSSRQKNKIFNFYMTLLFIIAMSMFTQYLNFAAWLLFVSTPNYTSIIVDFSDLVGPAFRSLSLYIPLVAPFIFFRWLHFTVNDTQESVKSIWDYGGIRLDVDKTGQGSYSYEIYVCKNSETGEEVKFSDNARFRSLFVCGGSGTGKTSLVFEPFIAKDIEKKFFFKEMSKELGFTALKSKIATLNAPYDNDYLNKNFNLNMISPIYGKESVFNAFLNKMTIAPGSNPVYKDLGITVMSPDYDIIGNMTDVCKNYGFSYNIIDPTNSNSIGINPFVYDDPSKIAITISSALKAMYNDTHTEAGETYKEDVSIRAIENIAILLKEMYPRMNEGKLPNMHDMLKMLSNFELIEKMCKIMSHDETLAQKHAIQIAYFQKNFYKDAPGKQSMERALVAATSQLDNLLRIPGIKSILCNRNNNINFDNMLANGELTFVCTRRGDLGASAHKAFGLFFLISMEDAVLRRPGNTNTRIPNFLYIDEFADFIGKATEPLFTMFRKYKVATAISTQNLAQLEQPGSKENYRNTILSNCANKIFTGEAVWDELTWWSQEFGTHREWSYSNTFDASTGKYDPKYGNVLWKFIPTFPEGKLQAGIPGNKVAYKILKPNGAHAIGIGSLKRLDSKYKEPKTPKSYDFEQFANNSTSSTQAEDSSNNKFKPENINFNNQNDSGPIRMNTSDSNYEFDSEDAIISNFKKKK